MFWALSIFRDSTALYYQYSTLPIVFETKLARWMLLLRQLEYLDQTRLAEQRRGRKLSAEAKKRRLNRAKVRTLLTKTPKTKARLLSAEKARKARVLSEENERQDALLRLPAKFDAAKYGQGSDTAGGKAGRQAREECLQRLFLRSPSLPVDLAAQWPDVRKWYAKHIGSKWNSATGSIFLEEVNKVVYALSSHLNSGRGKTAKLDSALGCAGDPAAFKNFVRITRNTMLKEISTAAASVTAILI